MTLPYISPLGPTLETDRLILRPPVDADFEGYCAFHADETTMTHIGGVVSPPVVWRTMRTVAGSWALDGFGMFSVVEKSTGDWIGRIGPLYPHGWPDREVGWGLMSKVWGKGYAREAAVASMNFVFDALGWDKAIHTIAPVNKASSALARSLGSYVTGQAYLPDPYSDILVDVWGQTREDWQINKQKRSKA